MKINTELAKLAIKLPEFQKFMQEEIKITDEQLKELVSCGGVKCWGNFVWLDKTISKINKRLEKLKAEGKLEIKKSTTTHEIYTNKNKKKLLEDIENSDADTFQVFFRKKQ